MLEEERGPPSDPAQGESVVFDVFDKSALCERAWILKADDVINTLPQAAGGLV